MFWTMPERDDPPPVQRPWHRAVVIMAALYTLALAVAGAAALGDGALSAAALAIPAVGPCLFVMARRRQVLRSRWL